MYGNGMNTANIQQISVAPQIYQQQLQQPNINQQIRSGGGGGGGGGRVQPQSNRTMVNGGGGAAGYNRKLKFLNLLTFMMST